MGHFQVHPLPPQMVILAEDHLDYYVQLLNKMDWTKELVVVQTLPLFLEWHPVPHKKGVFAILA